MTHTEVHLAYTPRGVGLTCALMYLKAGADVYGWWMGRQGTEYRTAYFRLADFYSTGTRLFVSEGSDLYGGWTTELTAGKAMVITPPLVAAQEVCHMLEQAQDAFCGEWLVLPGDEDLESQHHEYAEAELAWNEINFQFRKLNKFTKDAAVWSYYSKDFEAVVGEYLMRRWPLDYRG